MKNYFWLLLLCLGVFLLGLLPGVQHALGIIFLLIAAITIPLGLFHWLGTHPVLQPLPKSGWLIVSAFLLGGILRLDFFSMMATIALLLYKGLGSVRAKILQMPEPGKRSGVLSLILIGGGLFFVLENTFLWRLLSPGVDLLLGLFVGLSEFVAWITFLAISFNHLSKSWGQAKLLGLVPLMVAVVTTVSSVLLASYLSVWYRDHVFNTNYASYEAAVEYVLKERGEKDSQLPQKFRHLSQEGYYDFWSQGNDVNVVFFYRHGFPADADVFVYSPTGKMIPEWFRVEKKLRDNWYFVMY